MYELLTQQERQLIQHFPFAQLICIDGEQPVCTSSPVIYLPEVERFALHLSKANPVAKIATRNISVVFQAQEQYISPEWHQQQVVPTWNYAQLQLDCALQQVEDSSEKQQVLSRLSAEYEQHWSLQSSQLSAKQVQQMLKAITVYYLNPQKLTSRFKLSQNKSLECRQAFAEKMQQQNKELLARWQLSPPQEHRSLLCNSQ